MTRQDDVRARIAQLVDEVSHLKYELRELVRQDQAQTVHVGDCFMTIDGATMIVTELDELNHCWVNSVVVKPPEKSGGDWRVVHFVQHDLLYTSDVAELRRATLEDYRAVLTRANTIVSSIVRGA